MILTIIVIRNFRISQRIGEPTEKVGEGNLSRDEGVARGSGE